MRLSRRWIPIFGSIIFLVIGVASAQTDQGVKELQPFQSMSGIISGTVEPKKILLSSNDKVIIDLHKAVGIKPGDYVEIYHPLDPGVKEIETALFKKVGLGIVIEKIQETKAVCIIDSSIKEIAVGDLVLVLSSR